MEKNQDPKRLGKVFRDEKIVSFLEHSVINHKGLESKYQNFYFDLKCIVVSYLSG